MAHPGRLDTLIFATPVVILLSVFIWDFLHMLINGNPTQPTITGYYHRTNGKTQLICT
jgi:hypothetical protein